MAESQITAELVRDHRQELETHWEKRKHSLALSDTEGQEVNPSHCRQLRREGVPAPPSAIILKAGQLAGVRSYKGPSVHRELSPVFPRFTTSLNFSLYKPTELTRVWDTLQTLLSQNASLSQFNCFCLCQNLEEHCGTEFNHTTVLFSMSLLKS